MNQHVHCLLWILTDSILNIQSAFWKFVLFSGVGFHLGRGMESIKIHGAIHVDPLIIKLPEGLAGCCQGKSPGSDCPNVSTRVEMWDLICWCYLQHPRKQPNSSWHFPGKGEHRFRVHNIISSCCWCMWGQLELNWIELTKKGILFLEMMLQILVLCKKNCRRKYLFISTAKRCS